MAAVVGRQWKMFKIDFENVFLDVDLEKEVLCCLVGFFGPFIV